MKELRTQHQIFCKEYVSNGNNALAAYQVAYPNVTRNTAMQNGFKMLKRPAIQAQIQKEKEAQLKKYEVTKEMMIEEVMRCIQDCKDNDDRKNLLKSVEIINKMCGFNAAEKQEIKHEGITIVYNKPNNDYGN